MEKIRCKFCATPSPIKRGLRKTKNAVLQMYECKKCSRRFSITRLPSYTYPPEAILSAPAYFYQGYSLKDIKQRIKTRFKVDPSIAVISKWIQRFGKYSALKDQRASIKAFDKPHRIIKRTLLTHKQNYLFQLNRFKLSLLPPSLQPFKSYLENVTNNINADDFTLRCSNSTLAFPLLPVTSQKTYACRVADVALKGAATNYDRHSALQRFFLTTDKSTVAVEVPVFLTSKETEKILGLQGGLLGHIDFLQTFPYHITILDYKPNASKEKHVQIQLLLYAIALSVRTNTHLKYITCAWFDENDYYHFPAIKGYFQMKNNRQPSGLHPQ